MLAAAIFDLDGTMVNNNPYHIQAWQQFYTLRNRHISEAEYKHHINGKTNADVLKYVFAGETLSAEQIAAYTDEKEALYRTLYAPHIQPLKGLLPLLHSLHAHGIPIAMATSGIPVNIDFFFEHIPIRHLFTEIVNSTHISFGKPHPEIYLAAARKLGVSPTHCVAFEDAVPGIASAKNAGCKVVALTTTHAAEDLQEAHAIEEDFTTVNLTYLENLVGATT
ncbi:MAG: HAD family phosphatase [Bacteroidetes bacterium]|nr:MAG: HAD family phosphatase [Bacteroidota bacterium]TAE72732.1 MAG: HAD family phosphatase [Bacteroidota bacterium]TAF91062.1 MAG: HAD family phosphatase [Bacteroidota bacterium]